MELKKTNNAMDVYVGQKLEFRRVERNLTQEDLGEFLKISDELIQKYERGEVRIIAEHLHALCEPLNVEPLYFFAGITQQDNISFLDFLNNSSELASDEKDTKKTHLTLVSNNH